MRSFNITTEDNKPDAIKTIRERGSSTTVYVIPRLVLKEFKKNSDSEKPGLYLLFGQDEATKENMVYVGQSSRVYNRITTHDIQKEFWDVCFVATGDLEGITPQLEYLASEKAQVANRYRMANKLNPPPNLNSSELIHSAKKIFDDISYIVSVFGFSVFEEVVVPTDSRQTFYWKTDHAAGRGILLNEKEFLVYKDSIARIRETDSFNDSSGSKLRNKLAKEGILRAKDENEYVLTKDYTFSSPSAAADVIAGRSCNGWAAWKTNDGTTLDEAKRKKV